MKLKKYVGHASLLLALTHNSLAEAAQHQTKDVSSAALTAAAVALCCMAYTGNKWRLWFWEFRIGDASGSTFVDALKWTAASVALCAITLILV